MKKFFIWKEDRKAKWMPFLGLLLITLLLEVVVWNFSACKSLFYTERVVFEEIGVEGGTRTEADSRDYVADEGMLTLHVGDVKQKVHNLRLALEFSGHEPVYYTVSVSDEGNYYPFPLPEQVLMPDVPSTYYTNLYPAGEVSELYIQLTVPAGSVVTVNAICANARIPFVFSIGRMLVVYAVMVLVYWAYSVGHGRIRAKIYKENIKQNIVTVVVMLLLVGMAWKLAHINPICVESPWPHHKQYQELAEALADGKVYLAAEPSPELVAVENPYDTIYLQANGIHYQADYAYFEGKYYVYFGVVPELLLYFPCYLLTGHHLPNYMAVFMFYSGFIVAVFALYREIVKRWFANTPYFLYLMACVLTVGGGNYLFMIARPDLYNTPIMAANMFTVAGLWLWIAGKYAESVKGKRVAYLLGSLCMALVAGCRPQMLLFSFLAVPLFWDEVIHKRELFGKKRPMDTVCICLPYVLVAAGIMYYNAVRFGSPFDFGATYSLTSNDMTKRSFNIQQTLLGLWHYFVKPPVLSSEFPFLQSEQVVSDAYMGRLNAEYSYGGMLLCNALLWVLFMVGKGKEVLKQKGLRAFVLVNVVVSVVLGVVDVTGAGILQRYMADMIWGLVLAAVVVLFAMWEQCKDAKEHRSMMVFLVVVCLLQLAYGFGVVFGNGDMGVNVRVSNPELYYYVKSLFGV